MSESLILNEASLPFFSVDDCEENLAVFFEILHSANLKGITFYRADDLEGGWSSLVYAQGFEFGKWISKIKNNDQCRLVKSVIGNVKCRLISNESIDQKNSIKDMLFVLLSDQDIEVKGLGVASILNACGISFASHTNWKVDPVTVIQQWDEVGAIQKQNVNVPNIYSQANLDKILDVLAVKKQSNKNYFCNLTARDNIDFPHLIFCESALKDLRSSSVTALDFPRIISVLNKLDKAICRSTNLDDLIKNSGLDISGESTETMNAAKHARKRLFKHPNLGRVLFEDHVKNFADNKRMHLLADYVSNNICIGYFGRHLSTVTTPK